MPYLIHAKLCYVKSCGFPEVSEKCHQICPQKRARFRKSAKIKRYLGGIRKKIDCSTYSLLLPPPTCVFRLEFQPALLSEPARSAEKFLPFFGYQAAIPTCAVVWGFREMRRLVGGGVSCNGMYGYSRRREYYCKLKLTGPSESRPAKTLIKCIFF